MASVLILYSTTDGHTRRICTTLAESLQHKGNQVTLADVLDAAPPAPAAFDKVVIGASIRYGRHARVVYDLIARERDTLCARPSAFFSVNLVARKPQRDQPQTNPYVKKFLRQIDWKPDRVAVFAGKLNYPVYALPDRLVIQLIMWMTKGPTDPDTVREFTDWEKVEAFAAEVDALPVRGG
jgi:menaquinone-dependent protoporphyrinogen oxidase